MFFVLAGVSQAGFFSDYCEDNEGRWRSRNVDGPERSSLLLHQPLLCGFVHWLTPLLHCASFAMLLSNCLCNFFLSRSFRTAFKELFTLPHCTKFQTHPLW